MWTWTRWPARVSLPIRQAPLPGTDSPSRSHPRVSIAPGVVTRSGVPWMNSCREERVFLYGEFLGYRDNLIQQVMWKTVIIRSISFTYVLVNLIFWGNFLLRACYTPPLVSIELRSRFAFLLSWWNFIGSTSPNRELFRLPVWYPPQNEQQTPPENGPKAKRMFRYSIPTIPFPETKVLVSGSVMTIKVWIIGVLPPVFI